MTNIFPSTPALTQEVAARRARIAEGWRRLHAALDPTPGEWFDVTDEVLQWYSNPIPGIALGSFTDRVNRGQYRHARGDRYAAWFNGERAWMVAIPAGRSVQGMLDEARALTAVES